MGGEHSMNHPLLSMRLRANDTDTPENWKETFQAIASNPGCCDEIWFSTGIGVPPLEWVLGTAAGWGISAIDGTVPIIAIIGTNGISSAPCAC